MPLDTAFGVTRRQLLATLGAGTAGTALAFLDTAAPAWAAPPRPALASQWEAATNPAAIPPPSPEVHALNRLTFGIRPEDLAHVQRIGVAGFIAEQLRPETLDDSAVDGALAKTFSSLGLAPPQIGTVARDKEARRPVALELKEATIYRAVASRRQLYEMLVDFWSNHFNIYHFDSLCAALKTADDRDVVRPHVLGDFGDFLRASAASPAMLIMLNNAQNKKGGPNENYAREVMELHTISVNGGYTQEDVQEIARCFTGWTLDQGGAFQFVARNHDTGAKTVLGTTIPAGGGMSDGEQVLALLAAHPATANFLATKLCRRFLSDTPPSSAVAAAAATFTATGGDLREVMRTILTSADFAASADAKAKRPFELVSAAVRALGAKVTAPQGTKSLYAQLKTLGQSPFDWQAPNGYPDATGAWINSSGLLDRWNLIVALVGNALPGVQVDLNALVSGTPGSVTPRQLVDRLTDRLLHRQLTSADRGQLLTYAAAGVPAGKPIPAAIFPGRAADVAALLLDSPYFQLR
jgi:uncharacterized protein (DUF1800 family)